MNVSRKALRLCSAALRRWKGGTRACYVVRARCARSLQVLFFDARGHMAKYVLFFIAEDGKIFVEIFVKVFIAALLQLLRGGILY